MRLVFKEVSTIPEFVDYIRLRQEVFVLEQGFNSGFEPDEDDKTAKHFIALDDDRVVSTARYRVIAPGEYKIERMTTEKDYRGKGIGKKLIEYLLGEIKKHKPNKIWLNSQVQAQKFYENCGFKAVGKPFDEYGVMHILMEYTR